MPSEILDAIKWEEFFLTSRLDGIVRSFRFELVDPVGLDQSQLKDIPYENIK